MQWDLGWAGHCAQGRELATAMSPTGFLVLRD